MPRKAMSAPEQIRLMDKLTLGALIARYPRNQVELVLNKTKTNSIRRRLLPAFLVVYLVMVIGLYPNVSVREALRITLERLRKLFGQERIKIGVGSAITKARQRLGVSPFKELYRIIVKPTKNRKLKGCYYRGKHLVAIDGNTVNVQDTSKNRKYFGSHSNQHGVTGYPILKWVGLGECGTHIIFAMKTGGMHNCERELFKPLLKHLRKSMLLLADRYYYTFHLWKLCNDTGCSLLWRVQKGLKLKSIKHFSDGSYLAKIRPSEKLTKKGLCKENEEMTVRVIKYNVVFEDGTVGDPIRLITNLLDPKHAPAEELAKLYTERWHIETGFDEFKTHLKGAPRVLRSQLPELVMQEFYGFLLAYYVVRKVMVDAALKADIAPVELSFVHTVRVIKRKLSESFFP